MMGIATVETIQTRKEAGIDGSLDFGMDNITTISRNLMNCDELLRMDKDICIIILRGEYPLKLKKFYYKHHFMAKDIIRSNTKDFLPEWSREFRDRIKIIKPIAEEVKINNSKIQIKENIGFNEIEEV